ncbi:hypothetical protein [Micromonospora aurantiaca (nom. illeg.)]|uniref:Uncharacterized protein n=1 Tax=Micromonospora aurantiaca (nom. illeg.) TaxID=47850 RepID=A0A6N3JX10_9ACTN|nr:hypothetical protein [Micromonospora aurantiaca]ADL48783.1 hypothetical protein Micau_5277 [Micromonospora aurantiaca ATCC 27029]AXH88974.1 hypothetical protein DVH21_03010 [Micromonospora aurantiaca]
MSRELHRYYRSLAADTDERVLPAPDRLRRSADRWARRRAAITVLAAAGLVAGTVAGSRLVLAAGPGPVPVPPPAGTPTPRPSAAAPSVAPSPTTPPPAVGRTSGSRSPIVTTTPPAAATPTTIPDRAFFVLPAANDAGTGNYFGPGPVLPVLCGATPGDERVVAQRARSLPYRRAGAPADEVPSGNYRHSITIYRSGGAGAALAELRGAVRACPEQPARGTPSVTVRQRLLPDSGYGDESVLFETRTPYRDANGDPSGGDEVHLVRAVRSGDVVTVLWEQGWESTSTQRAQFDADSRRAVEAIRRWLD